MRGEDICERYLVHGAKSQVRPLLARHKHKFQGPSRKARLYADMRGPSNSAAAEQIPLSRLIVEDIMMKKDAEGGAPRDIFVVAQDEVSRRSHTQMHYSFGCLGWTDKKLHAEIRTNWPPRRDQAMHDRLFMPPASLAISPAEVVSF